MIACVLVPDVGCAVSLGCILENLTFASVVLHFYLFWPSFNPPALAGKKKMYIWCVFRICFGTVLP